MHSQTTYFALAAAALTAGVQAVDYDSENVARQVDAYGSPGNIASLDPAAISSAQALGDGSAPALAAPTNPVAVSSILQSVAASISIPAVSNFASAAGSAVASSNTAALSSIVSQASPLATSAVGETSTAPTSSTTAPPSSSASPSSTESSTLTSSASRASVTTSPPSTTGAAAPVATVGYAGVLGGAVAAAMAYAL